jgi:hypothetical protein
MKKTEQNKKLFLEQLEKTPVLQIACEKIGISRMTFHRWKEDETFARQVKEAMSEGKGLINDLAISQLISSIKEKNLGAIKFWLEKNNPEYSNKLDITATIEHEGLVLTPEQEAIVRRGLELVTKEHIIKSYGNE